MGRSPLCYIPIFREIGLPVPEKKNFDGFLPCMGIAAILVMWQASYPFPAVTFVELDSPMLHAKFQDHRTSGSREEDF